MAVVINGSGTVTGLAVGGLPDGSVDSDTLASGIDKTSISDSGDATAITIDSSENVGIGTTTPQTELEISAAQSPFLRLTSEKDGNHDDGDVYGELQFYTQETYSNAPVVAAKIQAAHLRAGTGHSNGDMGLAFFTSTSSADATATERMRIDSSGNVGIGGSPDAWLSVSKDNSNSGNQFYVSDTEGATAAVRTYTYNGSPAGLILNHYYAKSGSGNEYMRYADIVASTGTGSGTTMRFITKNAANTYSTTVIDNNGNLLVGTTDSNVANNSGSGNDGVSIQPDSVRIARTDGDMLLLNRLNSDGDIAKFLKNGTTVGSIGTRSSNICLGSRDTGLRFYYAGNSIFPCDPENEYANRDNSIDLGYSSVRFDDIYATNGTIQTSDRNEKQDIEELSEAEQRVAIACKGLMRKFRWKDAVAEKGDDARIHFGIIAQDLQDAFADEGLDAGRYAMFISTTWWETQTEVPAVEAVEAVEATYDDEGNELTPAVEAVEAKEAYTRTDTFDTLEEAPEGATERTRMGVRYPELLAFIISAL